MLDLSTPIQKLNRVGPRFLARLNKLGIKTMRDLLWHFPSRYDDYSQILPIANISEAGQHVSVLGKVIEMDMIRSWRRRLVIVNATIGDESGIVRVVWFNQPYIVDTLKEGALVSLAGKVSSDKKGLYLSSPTYEKIQDYNPDLTHTGRLVPVYPETEGLTSKYLRFLIRPLLERVKTIADPLPKEIIQKYNFPKLMPALNAIHFPTDINHVQPAIKRFAFEELLFFQMRALHDHRRAQSLKAPPIKFDKNLIASFVAQLPFKLTDDQRLAAYEILQDLERPYPMNRLLNGDVGSGKTVVALIGAYQTTAAGYQSVFMAPTEILARQHFNTLKIVLAKSSIKVGLLTGSEARQFPTDEITEEKISKKLMVEKINKGKIDIIIGTHAVLQEGLKISKLGLVIIDEQHRFGVEQRMKLVKNRDLVPHLLSMTATPIPRTLALTIYGDLDVSLIKEKPKGRQVIITKTVAHNKKTEAHKFIDDEIAKGRQVFVICPRIEASEIDTSKKQSQEKLMWAEVKAVSEEYEQLSKKIFPHRRVTMLHGKMPAKDKNEIMAKFKDGHYDILVSTSVIEVGVDVPNATVMMIESAERFGLAQLHQFRGRVGRSQHQSYCFLFTSSENTPISRRLRALEQTDDGFRLAEADLKIRGPGEFTGVKQSGIPDIAMSSLSDIELIKKARLEARLLFKKDPTLKTYPLLAKRLSEVEQMVHFE